MGGKPREDQKPAVMLAIHEHLNIHGPSNWGPVKERFPDVSAATFWRWVKEAKAEIESSASRHGTAAIKLAQKRIRTMVDVSPERTDKQIKAQLPVAPSPAVIASMPGELATEVFDFMAYFNRMADRIELVARSAEGVDQDGKPKARNPMLLLAAARAQATVLQTYLQSQALIWDYEKLSRQNELVMQEIAKLDPDSKKALLVRLRELNSREGFTIDAQVR